jgi:hypothetical protein
VLEGLTTPRIQWRRKADVVFPNIDRHSEYSAHRERLIGAISGSSILSRYLDAGKLKIDSEATNFYAQLNVDFIESLAKELENVTIFAEE